MPSHLPTRIIGAVTVVFLLASLAPGAIAQPCTDYAAIYPYPAPLLGGIIGSGAPEDVALSGKWAYVAGSAGLQLFEITDPENPVHLGTADVSLTCIVAEGTLVYGLDYEGSLLVIDFAEPTAPQVSQHMLYFGLFGGGLAKAGDNLYVSLIGTFEGIFLVVDVSEPAAPAEIGRLFAGRGVDIAVAGSAAYLVLTNYEYPHSYLRVVDISDPTAPLTVTDLDLPGSATAIEVDGPRAYVSTGAGIHVVDLSLPLAPVLGGDASGVDAARDMAHSDSVLYAWGIASGTSISGLLVVDLADPDAPVLIGSETTYSYTARLACADARVYAASNCAGLRVYDAGDPASPVLEPSTYGLPGWATHVAVSATHAFIPGCALRVVDITDPSRPEVSAIVPMAGNGHNLCLDGDFVVWVGSDGTGGGSGMLTLVDVSEPAFPVVRGTAELTDYPLDVAVSGSYAYGTGQWEDVIIVDISDPDAPTAVGIFDIPNVSCRSITIVGSTAYVGASSFVKAGMYILDLTNPIAPEIVGHLAGSSYYKDIMIAGDRAYMIDSYDSSVVVADISDPAAPVKVGNLGVVVTGKALLYRAPDLYVAAEDLKVVDVSDPGAPVIVGVADFPGGAMEMALSGTRIAIAAYYAGLHLAEINCSGISAAGDPGGELPSAVSTLVASPNPFNPITSISYRLERAGRVRLAVHDLGGRLVYVLADGVEPAGKHEVSWLGIDQQGRALASGTYLLRLSTDTGTEVGKISIIR